MLASTVIAAYLTLWVALRTAALYLSAPREAARASPWITRVLLGCCFLLCVGFAVVGIWRGDQSVPVAPARIAAGILMTTLGIMGEALSLLSLGRLYALEMEIKPGHAVISSGMYRIVRHPIYLANNLGFLGLAVLANHWAIWAACPAHFAALLLMAREEERFLIVHLGAGYQGYRAEVPWMVLPGII